MSISNNVATMFSAAPALTHHIPFISKLEMDSMCSRMIIINEKSLAGTCNTL